MITKAVRIRTRIIKDTYMNQGEVTHEHVTKSIVITIMDEETNLSELHDKIVQAIKF